MSEVAIDTGMLAGATVRSRDGTAIHFFGGIPYAAPPVGGRRWLAPAPAEHWEGVRDASRYAPGCTQLIRGENSFRDTIANALGTEPADPFALEYSEDCLYLNVFSPGLDSAAKRPVMVWIHGGAHRNGTSSVYAAEELAARGVVVVTINYRLGPLGFFAHPELTAEGCRGNQGLLDTVAALQWVQRNIARFGGDAGNVTAFGESAGGHSTCAMMTSPLCKGLVHRAIAQSGVGTHATQLLDRPGAIPFSAEQAGVMIGEAIGCPAGTGQLAAMRALSAEEIIERTAELPLPGVIIDGYCQVANPLTVYRQGTHNDIPLMIGSNAYEGSALYWGWPMVQMQLCPDVATYVAEFERIFAEDADEALRLYPAGNLDEMIESSKRMCGDSLFGAPNRAVAQALAEQGKRCYPYYFTQTPAADTQGILGAFHAMEIGYVFGQDFLSPLATEADHELSRKMMGYWVNFATTGDPNGEGLPHWEPYDSNADAIMELGPRVGMMPMPIVEKYNVVMKGIDRQLAAVEGKP